MPTLKRCRIFHHEVDFDNCDELEDSDVHYVVDINAPALEYFEFHGHISDFVFLEKLDNLKPFF